MPLASTTLTTAAAEITFTSSGSAEAWSGFKDLVLVARLRSTANENNSRFRINNDSSSNAYWITTWVSTGGSPNIQGGTANTYSQWDRSITGTGEAADRFGFGIIMFKSINDTDFKVPYQTYAHNIRNSGGGLQVGGGDWRGGSSAMTEIDLYPVNGPNYDVDSAASLFGIKNTE